MLGHLWRPGETRVILFGGQTPEKVMDNVVSADVYGDTVAAVTADGSLWTWGRNGLYGFLGDGTAGDTFRETPAKITDGVVSVHAGTNVFSARKADGSIWSWGSCVGADGKYETRSTPRKDLDSVEKFVSAGTSLFAIQRDRSLWSWGDNVDRTLGNGADDYYDPIPKKILDHVTDVAGYRGAMALLEDGSVWTWGDGVYWENLPRTSNYYINTPHKFTEDVAAFSFDEYGAPMMIKRDGSLWACACVCGEGRTTSSSGSYKFTKVADNVLLPGQKPATSAPTATPSVPSTTPAATVGGFSDVKSSDYFAQPVQWAVERQITGGTSPTTFSPGQNCTTGQILTFLWRACGQPAPASGPTPFALVKESDYFYQAARWAYDGGIAAGDFDPSAACTRANAVYYIWWASGSPSAASQALPFSDVSSSAFYAPAVAWAVEQGVTGGTGANTFSPMDTCTRGQIVTFLHRAMG